MLLATQEIILLDLLIINIWRDSYAVKDSNQRKTTAGLIIVAFCVLYATGLSRVPSMDQSIRFTPFWSYAEVITGQRSPSGILLNIALFIPFGWFLAAAFSQRRKRFVFLLPILFSLIIELIQFYTGRGTADIDDVISNGLGGAIGVIMLLGTKRLSQNGRSRIYIPLISVLLLVAASIGVYSIYQSPYLESRLRDYDFVIEDVEWTKNLVVIRGTCSVYDRETPQYQILLTDGKKSLLDTVIDGTRFTANGEVDVDKKYEVLIRFSGHETMSTGTWIHHDKVEFIAGTLPVVDGLPDRAVLKAYDKKTDTMVYQDRQRLLWLIGSDIDPATEIIYHIHTAEQERLPENRKKYGFDNRGFKTETGRELESIGHYRVFEKELPIEYHVTEVIVGFNAGGKLIWEQNFRVDYD